MDATYRKLSLQYRKNGKEYIDYLIGDNSGYVKSISPLKWTKLSLPDNTSDYNNKECYNLLIKGYRQKISFGAFLDIINNAKNKGINLQENPKEFYLYILNK